MGLDIYAGPVSRYVLGDWLTIVQQAGAASGMPVEVVRANEPDDAISDPAIVSQAVQAWRDALVGSLGLSCAWDEETDREYLTDKPDWDGYGSVVLLAAYEERPDLAPGETVRRGLRRSTVEGVVPRAFANAEAYKAAAAAPARYPTLLRGAEWCLPLNGGPAVFEAPTPNGTTLRMGRVDRLAGELAELNDRSLRLNGPDMEAARQAGSPEPGAPVEDVAPFGLSVLTRLAEFSLERGLPWILDY